MKIIDERGKIINLKNEHIEQSLAEKYIESNDKILELGARYGSVSIVCNKKLNDSAKNNHYVVEPDSDVWECLEKNMIDNGCDFNIIHGIIGKKKYTLSGKNYEKISVESSESDIQSYPLPLVEFDTLIIDCEGYLERFYNENKPLFMGLKKMIIECDRPDLCDYEYCLKEFKNIGFIIVEEINHYGLKYYVFKRPDYLFCSLSNRPILSEPMFNMLQIYCDKWKHKCVLEKEVLDNSRAPSWSKIKLLQREMKNNPLIPYLVWVDDDILLTNHKTDFSELIKDYPFAENSGVLVSEDVLWSPFNCGMIVVKNNEETYKYFDDIWELCEKYPDKKHNGLWEQDIMVIHDKMVSQMNPNQSYITKVPHNILQSFHRDHTLPKDKKWRMGDFSAHFTGMELEKKMKYRDEVLKSIIY